MKLAHNTSGNKNRYDIKKIVLNTSGKVNVGLTDIKLGAVSGNLSDDTMINIPVGYLKQMIK